MVPLCQPRRSNRGMSQGITEATRAGSRRLFDRLDWSALGAIYCEEGGEAFWDEHREPALELGLRWAEALGPRLRAGGLSLYVGAGVAELPVLLHEVLDLDRRVIAANRRAEECAVLAAGLRAAGLDLPGLEWAPVDARERLVDGPFDHLALVSALTDPETWPLVSAVTYGRVPPVLLDLEAFARERADVAALVSELGAALDRPATITTTVDEVPWLMAWADSQGLEVDADDELIDTAIVGDPLGFLRVYTPPSS